MDRSHNALKSGFRIEKNVLSPNECETLLEGIANDRHARGRAGVRNLMSNAVVRKVSGDPRLISIASKFVGATATPYRATLFEKSGRSNWLVAWHQDAVLPLENRNDSKEWGPWSSKAGILYGHAPSWALERVIALRIHLDDSTEFNGPLCVVPDTHRLGVLPSEKVVSVARAKGGLSCLVAKGGVIAMRPLLIHASSKVIKNLPRRVLHIEYADALDLNEKTRLAIA